MQPHDLLLDRYRLKRSIGRGKIIELDGWYWSSTEYNEDERYNRFCAWSAEFRIECSRHREKNLYHKVRAVSAF